MKYRLLHYIFLWIVILPVNIQAYAQDIIQDNTSSTAITGIFRNVAEISDSAFIELIFNDFLIPENVSEVERIEIIDVSNIGFGSNDILVIYPSRNVYMLDRPSSDDLLRQMQSWRLADKRRDAENRLGADYFYPGKKDSALQELERVYGENPERNLEGDLVLNALISDILTSLQRNYTENSISLRFERDDEGFTFQLWDFQEEALVYNERPDPDTVFIADEAATEQLLAIVENESQADDKPQTDTTEEADSERMVNGFQERAGRISLQNWIHFNASFLSSFLNNTNYQTNYHQGLGAELGIRLRPSFLVFAFSAGVTYHPMKKANPIFSEDSQATNVFGIGQAGFEFTLRDKVYISPTVGIKSSVYYYLKDWTSDKSQSLFLTFGSVEIGLKQQQIGIFGRQSLATRPEGQSIVEYGIRYGF